ncbi:MAG: hypothetical protein E7057_03560 [Lentisphaerae bacterium]|nr:hypothetical protein [Lentisphaerota bacterium]
MNFRLNFILIFVMYIMLGSCFESNAATLARYQLRRVIDRGIVDESGNGYDGSLSFNENNAFININGLEAVRFSQKGDMIKLPSPLSLRTEGSFRLKFMINQMGGKQYLWHSYSPTGDGMAVILNKQKISVLYFERETRLWHEFSGVSVKLQTNQWHELIMSWSFPGQIIVILDGDPIFHEHPTFMPHISPKDSTVVLGNERGGEYPLLGNIASFEFFDTMYRNILKRNQQIQFPPHDIVSIESGDFKLAFSKKYQFPIRFFDQKNNRDILPKNYLLSDFCLWRITFRAQGGKGQSFYIDNRMSKERRIKCEGNKATLIWSDLSISELDEKIKVIATVTLDKNGSTQWHLKLLRSKGEAKLWKIEYPFLPISAPSKNIVDSKLAVPNYTGQLLPNPFGDSQRDSDHYLEYSYPANMPMQFIAFTHPQGSLYLATHDGQGYLKTISLFCQPKRSRITYCLVGLPSNSEQHTLEYSMPYQVTVAPFQGDWFDACQIYRHWAIQQKWCNKGTLAQRTDIPEYLKKLNIVLRMWGAADDNQATVNLVRSIRNRGKGANQCGPLRFSTEFKQPIVGFWYDWIAAKYTDNTAIPKKIWAGPTQGAGNGRFIPAWSDIPIALALFKNSDVRALAYINAVMYDQGKEPLDTDARELLPAVIENEDGQYKVYNSSIPCWRMNVASEAWQTRFLQLVTRAMQMGFSGIYLDSFGRAGIPLGFQFGGVETVGRGDFLVQAQRDFGTKVRNKVREYNQDGIISAEAATENYIDLVDLNLIHFNVLKDSCPLFFAVYHDYQIFYGRTFHRNYWGNEKWNFDNYRYNLAQLFFNGVVLGRFFQGFPGEPYPFSPQEKEYLSFLKMLVKYRNNYLDFLHLGQMMRPPQIRPIPEKIKHGTAKRPYTIDSVMSSSFRAANGNVMQFFGNLTDKTRRITINFAAVDYQLVGAKVKMTVLDGEKIIKKMVFTDKITYSLELSPWQVIAVKYEK